MYDLYDSDPVYDQDDPRSNGPQAEDMAGSQEPPTPIDELRVAAEKLRHRADAATPGPWSVGNGEVIGLGIEQTGRGSFTYGAQLARVLDDEDREEENPGGHSLGSTEDDARWIALASPVLAEPLAAGMDELADTAERHVAQGMGNHVDEVATGWLLDLARLVNSA